MVPQPRLGAALDFAGAGGLAVAAIALISDRWFSLALAGDSFTLFFGSLAFAVSSFGLARAVQIARVLAQSSDPRKNRAEPSTATNVSQARPALAAVVESGTDSDLQRAA